MAVRANEGHRQVIERVAQGLSPIRDSARASEIRGMRTCFGTVCNWGCLEKGTSGSYYVTERGYLLLGEMATRWGHP